MNKEKLIPIHPYAYRHKNYENDGEITGTINIKFDNKLEGRNCYEVTYPDGFVDYVQISDIDDGNYKIIRENE